MIKLPLPVIILFSLPHILYSQIVVQKSPIVKWRIDTVVNYDSIAVSNRMNIEINSENILSIKYDREPNIFLTGKIRTLKTNNANNKQYEWNIDASPLLGEPQKALVDLINSNKEGRIRIKIRFQGKDQQIWEIN
jgi:hypothetical protein